MTKLSATNNTSISQLAVHTVELLGNGSNVDTGNRSIILPNVRVSATIMTGDPSPSLWSIQMANEEKYQMTRK